MRFLVLSSALLVLAPAIALADGTGTATADSLFRDGRRAADAGNFAVACPKFEESYKLDPAPGTLLNLADCEENRGQLSRAWQHFRQLHDLLPVSDDRRPIAEKRAQSLELRAPKLRIVLTSSVPASVMRDDVLMVPGSLGVSLPVDLGKHVIVVTAPGRQEMRYEMAIAEGDDKELSVSSGELLPSGDAQPVVVVTHAEPDHGHPAAELHDRVQPPLVLGPHDGSVQRKAAFVVGGVGVVSLVAGTIFGVVALSRLGSANAGCTGNVCASQDSVNQFHGAQSFALAADVTIVLGVALIGTAVSLSDRAS